MYWFLCKNLESRDKFPETVDILPWHVVRSCRLCRSVIFTGDIRKTNAALDFLKRTITDDYKQQRTLIQKNSPFLSVLSPFKSVLA